MMDKTQTSPLESAQEFLVMRNLYESAVKQLALKFEVLNSEFNIQYSRSPIHHIEICAEHHGKAYKERYAFYHCHRQRKY